MDEVLPSFLTLPEAAAAVARRIGREWTLWDVIACAERGEITVWAPWTRAVRLVRYRALPDQQNELMTVVNAWSPIPTASARSLLITREYAAFRSMPGLVEDPFSFDENGRPNLVLGDEWLLADGQEPPQFRVDQCRTSAGHVEQMVERHLSPELLNQGSGLRAPMPDRMDVQLRDWLLKLAGAQLVDQPKALATFAAELAKPNGGAIGKIVSTLDLTGFRVGCDGRCGQVQPQAVASDRCLADRQRRA